MKRTIFVITLFMASLAGASLISCGQPQYEEVQNNQHIIKVSSNANKVVLSGDLSGKTILYTTINPSTSKIVSADKLPFVTGAVMGSDANRAVTVSGTEVESTENEDFSVIQFADADLIQGTNLNRSFSDSFFHSAEDVAAGFENPDATIHFMAEDEEIFVKEISARSAAVCMEARLASYAADTFDKEKPSAGQTKTLWLSSSTKAYTESYNQNNYEQKECTLKAVGKNADGTIACLVWADSDLCSGSSRYGNKIADQSCEYIANLFAENYRKVQELTGAAEWENFYYAEDASGYSVLSLAECSPSKDYINIVIYDIGNDYGTREKCNIVGYFYNKDYKANGNGYKSNSVADVSNCGKYFYLDSAYLNTKYSGETKKDASDVVVSTLFHEYQHMINYGAKKISNNVASGSWYNEMLSMLVEDTFANELNLCAKAQPRGRLNLFNGTYFNYGLEQTSNLDYYYAQAFAFGSWLVRNYGEASLIKEMETNAYANMESVVAAVNRVNGTNVTRTDLLREFAMACSFRTSYAVANDLSSHFSNGELEKINLFGQEFDAPCSYEVVDGVAKKVVFHDENNNPLHYGPQVGAADATINLNPQTFVIREIGTTEKKCGSISVTFNRPVDSNVQMYIIIQDEFNAYNPDMTN